MSRSLLKQCGVLAMYLKHSKGMMILLTALLFMILASGVYAWSNQNSRIIIDMPAVNQIIKEVEQQQNVSGLKEDVFRYDFNLIQESTGKMIYQQGRLTDTVITDAVRNAHPYYEVTGADGAQLLVIIDTEIETALQEEHHETAKKVFLLLLGGLLVFICLFWYLQKDMIVPFIKLKRFAASVAAGNLDIPLEMNEGHIFGAFTESFDILREELKSARQKEYEANISKKELVASLSHDIKTPVTSIKLMCEVMMLKNPNGEFHEKISSIYQKAGQIDSLVTDMFHSTLEELGELQVNCKETDSRELQDMVIQADFYQRVKDNPIPPDCMLHIDTLRMNQIIGNIINNSYKYADTDISVRYILEEQFLQMTIRDYGEGVAEEELNHIFQKFYRGQNAKNREKNGAGLGLHICDDFMKKMEGRIEACNLKDGFMIKLYMKLS